ncbi:MAG: DUF3108 domain-containing protein [bacterium]|nr:DUF3108 domain-containing protein [bacterium]
MAGITKNSVFLMVIFWGFLGGATSGIVLAENEPLPNRAIAFGPGEKMVFSIGYGLVNAGEASVEVLGLTEYQGRTCYHFQSKANSNQFFSSVYKVRDKIVSYMDVEKFYSRYFYKRLREGDYRKSVEISFDHEKEVAYYANGKEYPTSRGVLDVLAAGYFVRTLELVEGAVYDVPAHSSRKTYDLKVYVHGKETIEVEAGIFECFVVEPIMQGEGLFKHEGKLTIYLSDDQYHVPVLVKAKVPVGSIKVELKSFQPGRPISKDDMK